MAAVRVGIFVEFNYEAIELWYPLLRFREEGMTTFTIGPEEGKTYLSKKGLPNKADKSIDNVTAQSAVDFHIWKSLQCLFSPVARILQNRVADLDVLIIPGGFAPDYWRRDQRFLTLVRDVYQSGKTVAAICHGPWMFVSAGILKGKRVTCFCSIKDDVINAGAEYEDTSVVVDGNMITSRIPADLPDFCKAILAHVKQTTK